MNFPARQELLSNAINRTNSQMIAATYPVFAVSQVASDKFNPLHEDNTKRYDEHKPSSLLFGRNQYFLRKFLLKPFAIN
jgi:hypothetical protein